MRLGLYVSNLSMANRLLVASVAANVVLSIAALVFVLSYSRQEVVTRIIPVGMHQLAEIGNRSANEDYKKSIALFISSMTGSLQPTTSSKIIDELSSFFAPEVFKAYRDAALDIINDPILKQANTSKIFKPDQVVYEASTDRVFVIGTVTYTGAGINKSERMVFEMSVGVFNGRPIVTYIKSYHGNIPQTLSSLLNEVKGDTSKLPEEAVPLVERSMTPDDIAKEVVNERGDIDPLGATATPAEN